MTHPDGVHLPYFAISAALAVIWIVFVGISLIVPDLSSYFATSIVRIASSGAALLLCLHALSRNRTDTLYKVLAFAIACVFLSDLYSLLHYLLIGQTLDYLLVFLPYLGSLSFMALLNFLLLDQRVRTHRILPWLALIPALAVAYAFWAIGHPPVVSILYAFIILVTAYTAAAVLLSPNGRAFLVLELCILVHAGLSVFWISGMTAVLGPVLVSVIQLLFIIAPLMYLPAFQLGVKKWRKS